MQKNIICNLAEGRQRFSDFFEHLGIQAISDNIEVQALQSVHPVSGVVQLRDVDDKQSVGEQTR